jgi:hypothetical protein
MTTSSTGRPLPRRRPLLLAAGLAVAATALSVALGQSPALAYDDDHGIQQVVLNPGGGEATGGSDGLRIVLNQNPGDVDETVPGSDQLYFAGTYQYCCGGVGPVLNVGGTPFGEAGASDYDEHDSWTTVSVVSTSGAVVRGVAGAATTGNGSAHLRYTADKGGRTYTVDRTVSYTYPNDYYTDSYAFTIPASNTDVVKFYKGGDTAPGSDDTGYGIMLTDPVRSVISLNPDSHIQVGQREIAGNKPFDGAVSESYSAPYSTVTSGGDLGFSVTTASHDAGFMTQWNLGSTPGTQTWAQETFVNTQGASLTAAFRSATVAAGTSSLLDLNVVNTFLTPVNPIGYTFTLPSGLAVATGAGTNGCGGTLSAVPGSRTITLSGGTVGAAANCLTSVRVVAASGGSYAIGASAATGLVGLANGVGSSGITVSGPVGTPGAPTSVAATADDSSVVVTWAPPASGAAVTKYRVTASPGSASCETTGLTCVLGGVAGTRYTVSVVALGAGDVAGPAATAESDTVGTPDVAPAPPTTPFRLTTTDGAITRAETGQDVTVLGNGFLPFSTATVVIYSTPTVLGTVTTNGAGAFSKQVTIPATLPAGAHTLVAYGMDTSGNPRSMTLAITVAAASSGSGSGTSAGGAAIGGAQSTTAAHTRTGALAYTGAGIPIGTATLVATGLLASGGALLLLARRRRGATVQVGLD